MCVGACANESHYAFIAQLVERCTCNAKVSGSTPDGGK